MNRVIMGMRIRTWTLLSAILTLTAVGAVAVGPKDYAVAQGPAIAADSSAAGATSYAQSLSKAFREAAQKALPAVVMIQSVPTAHEQAADDDNQQEEPFGQDPFGNLPPEFRRMLPPNFHGFGVVPRMPRFQAMSMGSGVVIDPSGVILTNNHVVEGGGKYKVRLQDGREFEAVDIKTDPKSDLAVLRIKGAGTLPSARFGNSDAMDVGDWVLALGDPFGLEGTVTAGIISAKGRPLGKTRASFIQTDAAINPGNSGGPLVNLDGEIVGINTAISSRNGGNMGVGFAIAGNQANWVSRQLVERGAVKRAYLGVGIQPVEQDVARLLGAGNQRGAIVSDVQPGTPAAEAGLAAGDVIVEFGGKPVANPQELQQAVDQAPIGAQEPVTVVRDGKRLTLAVKTREQPADYGVVAGRSGVVPGPTDSSKSDKLGVSVGSLAPEVAEKLGVKAGEGVVITEVRPDSPAAVAGVDSGMVIVQVNRKPIKSVEDFRAALDKLPFDKGVLLLIRSAQGSRYVVIPSG
jgi:serine protease Do